MAARSLVVADLGGGGITLAAETVVGLNHGSNGVVLASEAQAQFRVASAGKIDRPGLRVATAGGTTRTANVRASGSAIVAWAPPDGVSGAFVDSAGIAPAGAVTAGDLITLGRYSTGNMTYRAQWANFISPGPAATLLSSTGGTFSTASTARLLPVSGHAAVWTDGNAFAKTILDVTGDILGAHLYVSANARSSDTAYELYINDTPSGIIIMVPAGLTGLFQPSGTTSAPITAGQNAYWRMTTGAGSGAITWTQLGCTLQATTGRKSMLIALAGAGVTRTGSATPNYCPIAARFGANVTDETAVATKLGFPARLSNLGVLTGTAGYDSLWTVRVGGVATALAAPQLTGASGWAFGGTAVDVGADDEITIEWSGGASGSVAAAALVLTLEDLTPPQWRPKMVFHS